MGKSASWLLMSLCFLLTNVELSSEDFLDVETLPTLRSKQYPIDPYKKLIVFSAPRTGSSLVYNVLRFLFENDSGLFSHHYEFNQDLLVIKTHRFYELDKLEEKNVLYLFTIRNPIEGSISNYRICTREITDLRAFAEELVHRHAKYLEFAETLKASGQPVVIVKYEEFTNNLEHLFQTIETQFSTTLADVDKEWMKKGYAKENIYANTQWFQDFSEYFPVSGFHGKHVTLEKYNPPEEFFYWLNVYVEEVKPLFRRYGYFLD